MLPVITIEPLISIEPVSSIVSALLAINTLPESPLKLNAPETFNEPVILTD